MTFWYPAVTAEFVENMSELTHLPNLHQKKETTMQLPSLTKGLEAHFSSKPSKVRICCKPLLFRAVKFAS
jgi:hypothetical protein